MHKYYNQAFVVLLAVLVGVAVSNKLGETAGEVRQLTAAVSRQLSRSGQGVLAAGESFAARLRRDAAAPAPAKRPCRNRAASRG